MIAITSNYNFVRIFTPASHYIVLERKISEKAFRPSSKGKKNLMLKTKWCMVKDIECMRLDLIGTLYLI